ncbi:MAG: Coenzyme F420 hydrogenase/dehydrogenase, beta subunit C-terminal domain [Akkermansia muciniphila]
MTGKQVLSEDELRQLVPDCTGCAACLCACGVQAIRMVESAEGFYRPSIDSGRCVGCGKCLRTCPVLNEVRREAEQKRHTESGGEPKFLYGWYGDAAARENSSSGGVFTALARGVLQRGGCVFGAAMGADMRVRHVRVTLEEELGALRGAKYMQSRMAGIYREVKAALVAGRPVLFCGVPCQVGGLRAYLGYKDWPQLLTVDVVCHGVPTLHLMPAYLAEEMRRAQRTDAPVAVNFRDKCSGWGNYGYSVTLTWGDGTCRTVPQGDDAYMRAYLSNLLLSPACYNCRYSGVRGKLSDITLGDAWGIWEARPEVDCRQGVSLVVVHTDKGASALSDAKGVEWHSWSESESTKHNPALLHPSSAPHGAEAARRLLGRVALEKILIRVEKLNPNNKKSFFHPKGATHVLRKILCALLPRCISR